MAIKRYHRGIPRDQVKAELQELGYHPGRIHRILSNRHTDNKGRLAETKNTVINLPKTEKTIFNVSQPRQRSGSTSHEQKQPKDMWLLPTLRPC